MEGKTLSECFNFHTVVLLIWITSCARQTLGMKCQDCVGACVNPGACETSSKCFIRRDVNGFLYRGCADAERWEGLDMGYTGCHTQEYLGYAGQKVLWCFCNTSECNKDSLQLFPQKMVRDDDIINNEDTPTDSKSEDEEKVSSENDNNDFRKVTKASDFDSKELSPGVLNDVSRPTTLSSTTLNENDISTSFPGTGRTIISTKPPYTISVTDGPIVVTERAGDSNNVVSKIGSTTHNPTERGDMNPKLRPNNNNAINKFSTTPQPKSTTTIPNIIFPTKQDKNENERSSTIIPEYTSFNETMGSTNTVSPNVSSREKVSRKPSEDSQNPGLAPEDDSKNAPIDNTTENGGISSTTISTIAKSATNDGDQTLAPPGSERGNSQGDIVFADSCPMYFEAITRFDSCYRMVREALSFNDARARCKQMSLNADLITIETHGEFLYLQSRMKQERTHLKGWQGWWTSGKFNNRIREFTWMTSGHVISRMDLRWRSSLLIQPYVRTCVWMVPLAGFKLGNYGCKQRAGFICEAPMNLKS